MPHETNQEDYLCLQEAAKYLGITVKTLQNWIYQKKIPARAISIGRINGHKFINVEMVKGL